MQADTDVSSLGSNNSNIINMQVKVTPEQLKKLRKRSGLTQTEAGLVVYAKLRSWQNWETPTNLPSSRQIPIALLELFCIKMNIKFPPKL